MERKISWTEVHNSSEELALQIRKDFQPDVVIAIASGGLVPAKLLKEMLGVKVIGVISAHYYDKNRRREKCVVEKSISGFIPTHVDQKVLLVDDIVETGTTFIEVLKALPELSGHGDWQIKTAALLKKPETTFNPDYYSMETSDWVVFPWELDPLEMLSTSQEPQK